MNPIILDIDEDLAHELFMWLTGWQSKEFAILLDNQPIVRLRRIAFGEPVQLKLPFPTEEENDAS